MNSTHRTLDSMRDETTIRYGVWERNWRALRMTAVDCFTCMDLVEW